MIFSPGRKDAGKRLVTRVQLAGQVSLEKQGGLAGGAYLGHV